MAILLLDVMGTLVHEPFFEDLPRFLGMSFEDMMRDKHPSSWIEFEHGRIDEKTYVDQFFADGRKVDCDGLKAAMKDSYELLPGIESLLDRLSARGHDMHALSNYPSWYTMIEDKLTLSRFLSWSFVSFDTGVRKPDPEAYLGPARKLGVEPKECLFVDDRKGNCAAAEEVGMPSIVFSDAAQLEGELTQRGLL